MLSIKKLAMLTLLGSALPFTGVVVAQNINTTRTVVTPSGAPRPVNAAPLRAVIMQVAELPVKGARAVVVRRPSADQTIDMILVTSATTAHDLAKAVSTLMYSRRAQGVNVEREMRATISAAARPRGQPMPDVIRASADLNRLRLAQIIEVVGVGRGPAIPITTAAPPPRR